MNNNRFKNEIMSNNQVCSNCGASLPYGSMVCLNCKAPVRAVSEQAYTTKKRSYGFKEMLVPIFLITAVLISIITFAIIFINR